MWLSIKAPPRAVDLIMVPDGCGLAVYYDGRIVVPGFLDLTETATRRKNSRLKNWQYFVEISSP